VTRTVTLAAISLALASTAAQTPQRDRPRTRQIGNSSITGIVVSDEQEPQPLRRAHVTLQGSGLPGSEVATTQDDGAFAFAGLPAGRYAISAAKSAYVTMRYGATAPIRPGALLTLDGATEKKVTIRLPRGAVITGVLSDAAGQPLPGVLVTALRYGFSEAAGERRMLPAGTAVSTSDENGLYRIFGLPAGEYVVGTLTGQTAAALTTVSPADVRAALAEVRSSTVTGRRIPSTLTPKEAPPSKADVVMAPVYYPGTAVATQAAPVALGKGEERQGIDFQVVPLPAATVSGNLPLTKPLPMVTLTRHDGLVPTEPSSRRAASLDPFGRFSYRGVHPGRYTVSALVVRPGSGQGAAPDVQWATTDITVDGEDVSVGLSLQPALTIAGRVVFEGGARPAASMRLPLPIMTPISGAPGPFVQLEPDGRFTIDGVVGGNYRLGVVPGIRTRIGSWWLKSIAIGGRELLDGPLDLQKDLSDTVVTLSTRATELSGRVTFPGRGEQPSVFVIVFPIDRGAWFPNSRRVAAVRPDADGRYAISNLPAGDYFAVVDDNVDANDWFDARVLDRLIPKAIRVTLRPDETRTQDFAAR
jgi:hypothetical protein